MSLHNDWSRREFLSATAAGAAALATGVPALDGTAPQTELWELSAADAVAAMKRGDITAERFASALLARCKAAESLNAFITLQPERGSPISRNSSAKLPSRSSSTTWRLR